MHMDVIGVDVKRSLIFTIARRIINKLDATRCCKCGIAKNVFQQVFIISAQYACDVDREQIRKIQTCFKNRVLT